jgi:DNA-binding NarL/FixJ family response regulator
MEQPIRVLVAEDLDVLREHFAERIDRENDCQVVGQASSGAEAYALAGSLRPDVILMDIEMEVKHDGIHAAKKVLKEYPDIRIVFLTVHEDDETLFTAFEAGAVDYVLKTAPESDVLGSIRAAKRGESPIRPEIAHKIRTEFTRIRRNQSQMFDIVAIVSQLTPTELDIIGLLLQDQKIPQMAKARGVEVSTIKSQINGILKKFRKPRTKEVIRTIRELQIEHLFQQLKGGS